MKGLALRNRGKYTGLEKRIVRKGLPLALAVLIASYPATSFAAPAEALAQESSSLSALSMVAQSDGNSTAGQTPLNNASDDGNAEANEAEGSEAVLTITVRDRTYEISETDADQIVAGAHDAGIGGADALDRLVNTARGGGQVSDDDLLLIDVDALSGIPGGEGLAGFVADVQSVINAEREEAERQAAEREAAEREAAERAAAEQETEDDSTQQTDQGEEEDSEDAERQEKENTKDDTSGSSGKDNAGSEKSDSKKTGSEKTNDKATDPPSESVPGPQTSTGTPSEEESFIFTPNPTTDEFIALIGEKARKIAEENDLYASVMIAQAILESGSGSSGLSKPPNNNLFGIKGSYKGESVSMRTQEDDGSGNIYTITASFRRYPSIEESLQDYADLLTKTNAAYYAPARKSNAKTYVEACDYLQGHYATGTTYSKSLQSIITAYDLTKYDHPAEQVKQEEKKAEPKKAESKKPEKAWDDKVLVASISNDFLLPMADIAAADIHAREVGLTNLLALAIYLPLAGAAIAALFRACTKER